MKRFKKGLLIALAVIVVLAVIMFFVLTSGLSEAVNVSVGSVDLSAVEDGEYTGRYDFGRWSTAVTVQVSGHRIESIHIAEDVTAAMPDCADEMFRRVIEAQDTQVDAVSGATATSKAYLKAIEDALSP